MSESFPKSDKVVSISAEQRRPEAAALARLPAEMHRVRERSRQKLQSMLRGLFDKADDALFELADQATNNHDQNLYFDSMRQVRLRRREIEEGFFRQLDLAFASLLDQNAAPAQQDAAEPGLDSLSLVGNDELEELVASETMINRANEQFAERLQHLTMRMDQLVPIKVYPKNNPLGCDSVCKAFVDMAGKIDIDVKARLVLFKLFDKFVMTQLGELYDALNQQLIEAKILPSLQGAQASRSRRSPSASSAPPTSAAAGHSRRATDSDDSAEQLLGTLRELLGRPGGAETGTAASDAGGAGHSTEGVSSQDLLALLTKAQHHQPQAATSAASVHDVKAVITQLLSQGGASNSLNQVDEDVINLVSMMFEFILEDRSLASPMKAQLARLQIPMIKVAIADKSFFGKGGHPARRLLNEMATAALGWQDGGEKSREKDTLYQKIDQTVERIVNEFTRDIGIFETLLLEFRAFQEKEKRRAKILEQRTLDAEDGKAKSERARAEVAAALAEVTHGVQVPDAAAKLLNSAWANVLFITCLKQGVESEDWQTQVATAEDLVWSVSVEMTPENRQKLLKTVPSLLSRLRKGLEDIAFNPYEMGQLFKALEQLHIDILRGKLKQAPSDTPASPPSAQASTAVDSTGEQTPTEAKSSPPEAIPQTSDTVAPAPATAGADSSDKVSSRELDEQHLSLVGNLTQGSWFEMAPDSGERYRCRLAAIIKATGKYIFVNRGGMKVAEETRESLALALKAGRLRVLDDGMLFDRALESVISNLKASRHAAR